VDDVGVFGGADSDVPQGETGDIGSIEWNFEWESIIAWLVVVVRGFKRYKSGTCHNLRQMSIITNAHGTHTG
jgi:hypothetical protein